MFWKIEIVVVGARVKISGVAMVETENEDELLFFDTFSHDIHEVCSSIFILL